MSISTAWTLLQRGSVGPLSFHWSYAVLFIPPSVLCLATLESAASTSIFSGVLAATFSILVALGCALIYLAIVKPRSLIATAGYWLSAGIGLGTARVLSAVAVGAEPELFWRFASSTIATVVWIPTISVAAHLVAEAVRMRSEITEMRTRIDEAGEDSVAWERMEWARASAAVDVELLPRLVAIGAQLRIVRMRPTRRAVRRLAADISHVSRRVVRVMSRRAIRPGGLYTASTRASVVIRGIVRDAILRPITYPWGLAALLLSATMFEYPRTDDFQSSVVNIIAIIFLCSCFSIAAAATAGTSERLAAGVQWGSLLLVPVFIVLILLTVGFGEIGTGMLRLAFILPVGSLCAVVVSLLSVTNTRNRALAIELTVAESVLDALEGPQLLGIHDTRRRLALFLHGPVQGRLQAASHTLRLARSKRVPKDMDEVLRDVGVVIEQACDDLRGLGPRVEPHSVTATVLRLREDWTGLISVSSAVCPGVDERSDESTREVIAHLLTDMVTNASRHANADNAELVVDIVESDVIVVCTDDGDGSEAERACSGVVAGVLAERGGTWTVAGVGIGRGARSMARVPMTQSPRTRSENRLNTNVR
ncbi:signal transduction histidine kinase [Microbacterium endophyticum]|uniref:Signal transduction histidine kinase n=1 Tax=Microbacterium endophyticum TaxID=1526412 RepID=A0A7W4V3Z2_9MICO|nr:hypothetical protein [Microbacterium endophyticum]MBB2976427.1 signal transduction histidine kinase [Microbacterium endophyticum]NIK35873.1 signal transduction histidine kinase [Microbacterium endophyticum]